MITSLTPTVAPMTFGDLKIGDKFTLVEPTRERWNMKVELACVVGSNIPFNVIRLDTGKVRHFTDSMAVDKFIGLDTKTL